MAISSFVVSASLVGGATYVYLEKDNIISSVKENIAEEIGKIVPDLISGLLNSSVPSVPSVPETPGLPGGDSGSPVPGGEVPTLPF